MPPEDEVRRLTPEDVSNKRFTPVRLREGYDMGEVDQFLDQVEAELELLHSENEDLRAKLEAAQSGRAEAVPAPAAPSSGRTRSPRARGREARGRTIGRRSRAARDDQGRHRRRGLRSRAAPAGAGHPQRRRGRRRGEGGSASRSSVPPAPRPSARGEQAWPSRRRRTNARPERRRGDRGQAHRAARRHGEGADPPRQRGRDAPRLRARVPQPAQELLHRAAAGSGRNR